MWDALAHISPKTKILFFAFLLILLPGAFLSYLGLQSVNQKIENLRAHYQSTAALLSDNLEREILHTEGGVNSFILQTPLPEGTMKSLQRWLNRLQSSNPFLSHPFAVNGSGGLASVLISKNWHDARKAISMRNPDVVGKVHSAEEMEFRAQAPLDAIALYRQALGLARSANDKALLLSRIGRCNFKIRRYKEGNDEYRRILTLGGDDVFIGPTPATVVALSQIADGYEELGDSLDSEATNLQLYDYLLHHPWDIEGGEYSYYVQSVGEIAHRFDEVKKDTASRRVETSIREEIQALEVFAHEVPAKYAWDAENRASAGLQPRHVSAKSGNTSEQFGIMKLSGSVNQQGIVGMGYQFRPEYITNQLLPKILTSSELEPNISVALLNEQDSILALPSEGKTTIQLASDNLTEVFPTWKVVLFDRNGKSIEKLVGNERELYLALFIGIMVVMAVGIFVTVRAAAHEAEASRLKAEFVSNVSHELKTPLALIRMFGETLESGLVVKEDQRKEFYGIIRKESERLTHLIDNVLDFSRIDAGNKEYQIEEADLVEVVRSTLDAYKFHIRDLGFDVESHLPDKRIEVQVDKDAISQALLNLLSNATRYSDDKKYIRVEVANAGSRVLVSVEDHGVGIPKDLQGKIFEKFYRVPKEKTRETRGAGLGLTLTKHIIEAHRGTIECQSEVGKGSIFTIALPLELRRNLIVETILIVEDEKDMVMGLKFNLEARGFKVLAAYDGDRGYRVAAEEHPDLVILDLMLPKKNGYEVCKLLKQETPNVPIIMLTARSQEAEIVTGLELGADDYVTKPFSLLELIARINAVLRRAKSGTKIPETYKFGALEINFRKYSARRKGRTIELSPREFEILKYFIERTGETVSREDLLNHVWGYDAFPNTRTVDTHIAKLRQKIEETPDEPQLIVTLHGVGYKFLG